MSARIHNKARWLLVGAIIVITAGCAANQSGKVSRNEAGCPMNFVLTCDVEQPGARKTASNCGCVRRSVINAMLRGH